MVGGLGLDVSTGGDAVKVVGSAGACSDAAGGGTAEITDLSANGATSSATPVVRLIFTVPGVYAVCYKVKNGVYVRLDSSLIVRAETPTSFTDDGAVYVYGSSGNTELLTLYGGSGLDLREGGDAVKVVDFHGSCEDAASGGTSVVTNLGNDDSIGAYEATAQLSMTAAGSYMVCYWLYGGNWTQVGSAYFTVNRESGTAPVSDKQQITHAITYSAIPSSAYWHSETKLVCVCIACMFGVGVTLCLHAGV